MSDTMNRRVWIGRSAVVLLGGVSIGRQWPTFDAIEPELEVRRRPGCSCCEKWVERMRQAGFTVTVSEMPETDRAAYAARLGVPESAMTCHTGVVGGYVIEGHVPPVHVRRLLKDRPDIAGIGVSEMPAGSPGMEVSGRSEPYDVLAFRRDRTTYVFAHENGA
ncbi:MAG TPA: DUF411 domain-containing protein [Gemmatimonadaceae bacterium]|jgi:hypothetical protein|nr:DUF411 domain-containing protein [Gemmatimonadaceae bacterium]